MNIVRVFENNDEQNTLTLIKSVLATLIDNEIALFYAQNKVISTTSSNEEDVTL